MGMRINTNVSAISAMRNLSNTTLGMNKTLERLSTGLRINRAADDAAGLAISEGLKSQIKGLGVATRNANDAISLVQTAEGALAEQTNLVQRLRELAIQASNGSMSSNDRAAIQKEVDALTAEFDRISTQTTFNGVSLLNGYFGTKDIQVGVKKGETIALNLKSSRSNSMGQVAKATGAQRTTTTAFSFDEIAVNGTTIAQTDLTADGVSYTSSNMSAIAIGEAINAISGTTGVTATVQATVVTGNGAFSTAGSFTYTANELVINNVSITGSGSTIDDAVSMINAFSNQTGVTAESVNSGSRIVLTAADGRNVTLNTTGAAVGEVTKLGVLTASAATLVTAAAINLTSDDNFTVARGTSGTTNTVSVFGVASSAYSLQTSVSVKSVSLLTQGSASNAIEILDNTLRQLNSNRASLGATQNRLESTIRNLTVTQENLSAANSRVRDADIAMETGNLTKSQILQQAGISVLSQANVSTQSVLALLQ